MDGNKNKKPSEKTKLDAERFAYVIWSCILPYYSFPKEKINYEIGEKNSYTDDKCVSRVCASVMTISLYYGDDWKTMLESRLKASGFDTIEKIQNCLTSLLAITPEFKEERAEIKVCISLAAYSEMFLFLNYKSIDFSFRQIVNAWSRYFLEYIALSKSASDEILDNLCMPYAEISDFSKWVTIFMQHYSSPYESRYEVSTVYRKELKTRKKLRDEKKLQVARSMDHFGRRAIHAKNLEPSMPADFEMLTVLPGDRESSEPTLNMECGAVGGKEVTEGERIRSTGVAGCSAEKFPTVLPSCSETYISLPGDRESPKSRTRSTGVAGCTSGDFLTLLPCSSETSISLPGDRKPTKQRLTLDEGGVRSRKESSARNRQTNVTEYTFGEMLSFLSGDCKSYEPQLSLECDDVGGKEASKREWTQATGVEICRSGERESSKTPYEIELEEKFALMDLSRLPEDYDVISNKRKSRN